jgi:hypothetical protein
MKRGYDVLRLVTISMTGILFLLSCNRNNDKNDSPFSEETRILRTEKAAAAGALLTKVIGPEGGTFSFNGDVILEVPAGAVDVPTTFSIQPVQSRIQPKAGKVNYELLPHNVTFNKPVKITFSYDPEWFGSSEDAIQVAYRKETGTWHSLPTEVNKDNHTITVSKESFSEFEFFEKFILHANKSSIGSGEKTDLYIGIIYEDYDGLLAPLHPHFLNDFSCYFVLDQRMANLVSGWSVVEQSGTVNAKNSFKSIATYTAPNTLSHPEATVQVRVEGIKSRFSQNSTLILRKKIHLTNGWVRLTMDGTTHLLTHNLNATQLGQYSFGIAGTNENSSLDFSLAIVIKGGEAKAGIYNFGFLEAGTATAVLFNNSNDWMSSYYDCSVNRGLSTEGTVNILRWSHTEGDITSGNFSAKLYNMTGECDNVSKTISVAFEIPRSA